MESLKAFNLLHPTRAGVPLKHLNSKATTELDYQTSSVVRSPETFRGLRNSAWLNLPLKPQRIPTKTKLNSPLGPFYFKLSFIQLQRGWTESTVLMP